MARIAGVNIPENKHLDIALTHIFGIGKRTAQDICIDEYMNAPWSVELVIKIFLLSGFIFIIPLMLYLNSKRKL